MKKHILSRYAKKEIENITSVNSKKTRETRTVEQSDDDILLSKNKGTVKTFSIEDSDFDDSIILNATDVEKDSTETIENTDVHTHVSVQRTKPAIFIESSNSNPFVANKKTLLTDTIEQSDPDTHLWF